MDWLLVLNLAWWCWKIEGTLTFFLGKLTFWWNMLFFDVSPFLQLTVRPWNLVLGNYFPLGTPTCRCYVSSREANWGRTDILYGCPQWLRSRTKWKPFFQGGWPVVKWSSTTLEVFGDFFGFGMGEGHCGPKVYGCFLKWWYPQSPPQNDHFCMKTPILYCHYCE